MFTKKALRGPPTSSYPRRLVPRSPRDTLLLEKRLSRPRCTRRCARSLSFRRPHARRRPLPSRRGARPPGARSRGRGSTTSRSSRAAGPSPSRSRAAATSSACQSPCCKTRCHFPVRCASWGSRYPRCRATSKTNRNSACPSESPHDQHLESRQHAIAGHRGRSVRLQVRAERARTRQAI